MLFEAQIQSPGLSAYHQHEYFEQMFASLQADRREQLQLLGYAPRREYTWCQFDDVIYIRRLLPTNDMAWHPIIIPSIDSVIGFHIKVRPRKTQPSVSYYNETLGRWKRRRPPGASPTIIEPNEAMRWLEKRAESFGVAIEDAESEFDTTLIERPGITTSDRFIDGFNLATVNFYGVAKITDPRLFEQTLAGGIGDSKAFGFGFMLFWRRE